MQAFFGAAALATSVQTLQRRRGPHRSKCSKCLRVPQISRNIGEKSKDVGAGTLYMKLNAAITENTSSNGDDMALIDIVCLQ